MKFNQLIAGFGLGLLMFSANSAYAGTQVDDSAFVGTKVCATCHEDEYQKWQGSHHDMSMRHAAEDSVLGDFNNVTFIFEGKENKFFRKGKEYWVNIEGPDGKFNDYQIKYTFAYYPLQQYMVEFEDGRVQLIPFSWDSREAEEGGQRWFHLYPQFTDHREEFYWTNTGQNWNYMCADCHSTNVRKNFDVESNSYNTTFFEVNVGCEACHGAGNEHVKWAEKEDPVDSGMGFDRNLVKSVANWVMEQGATTLTPESIEHTDQTLMCAQCHSRHVQISDNDHVESKAFGDRYMLALLNSEQYYPDGQIYDEVFVYGSFIQSKMSQQGVVCTNCHEPHSNELIVPIENVCLQCHQANTYAAKTHHQHEESSEGAQCVACHMPETVYMQVDGRRDHGWHVPRSDLAKSLGSPDTCLGCHEDKNSDWSADLLDKWYPESKILNEDHFAPVFAAIDNGYYDAANALSHVAQNKANAEIVRASALERMAPLTDRNSLIAVARGARDPNEFIRLGAVRGAVNIAPNERWRILSPLLEDKVLAVRIEAASALMPLWSELSEQQKAKLQPALDDYLEVQDYNSDRGFAHNNIGTVHAHQGDLQSAEQAFKASIEIESNSGSAYVNLAELYRRSGPNGENNERIEALLSQGVKNVVENGEIHYAQGLARIRAGQHLKAAQSFEQATIASPNNAQYHYVYGLSLEKQDLNKAQQALYKAYQISRDPRQLYALCDMQVNHGLFQAKACIDELSKVAPPEVIEQLKAKLKQL